MLTCHFDAHNLHIMRALKIDTMPPDYLLTLTIKRLFVFLEVHTPTYMWYGKMHMCAFLPQNMHTVVQSDLLQRLLTL